MNENYGELIRQARNNAGLSQEQLAEAIGVAPSTLRCYETGNRKPKIERFKKIAEVCGVTTGSLLGIRDDMHSINYTKKQLFDQLVNVCNTARLITPAMEEQLRLRNQIKQEEDIIREYKKLGFEPTKEKQEELEKLEKSLIPINSLAKGSINYLEALSAVIAVLPSLNLTGLRVLLDKIQEIEEEWAYVTPEVDTNAELEELE